jgi:hypothetical protein
LTQRLEIARRKAAVVEAEELEKSAASITKARWQAAYDALLMHLKDEAVVAGTAA